MRNYKFAVVEIEEENVDLKPRYYLSTLTRRRYGRSCGNKVSFPGYPCERIRYHLVGLHPLDVSAYVILGGVIPMVLKFQCPECGKGEKSELVEVLPDRKYRMEKCGDCECTYILTASMDEENKCKKSCGSD